MRRRTVQGQFTVVLHRVDSLRELGILAPGLSCYKKRKILITLAFYSADK